MTSIKDIGEYELHYKKLGGEIVDLRGRILAQDGKTSLGAKGRVLITEKL